MPEPPKGGVPFELSMPDKLEALFAEAGLTNIVSGQVNCPFEYENFKSFWHGNVSAGPFQGVLQVISENDLKSAAREAVNSFLLAGGRVFIPQNIFKYVSANI